MVEILTDSFFDVIRIVPVLFLIILLTNVLTKNFQKGTHFFKHLAKLDVLGGAVLGIIPQCGISVSFARLYAGGYITLGMLLAVFLAGSDEALIIFSAHPDKLGLLFKVILFKIFVAVLAGLCINYLIKEKRNRLKGCGIDCACPKCNGRRTIFWNSLVHTLKIFLFLYITVFLINVGVSRFGEGKIYMFLGKKSLLQPIITAVIGMIPSCFSSVLIAEAYLKGALSFGAMLSGLCANTGYGILVLIKEIPLRKTIFIISLLLAISILTGEIFYFFG